MSHELCLLKYQKMIIVCQIKVDSTGEPYENCNVFEETLLKTRYFFLGPPF